jgi:hypothetical protein
MIISSEIGLLIIERIKKNISIEKNILFDDFLKKNEDIFILNLKLEEELTNEYLNFIFEVTKNNTNEDSVIIYDIIKYGKEQIKKTVFSSVVSEENKDQITSINKYKSFILFYDVELKMDKLFYLVNDDNILQFNSTNQNKISFEYIFNEVNKNYYYFVFSKKYKEYEYLIRKIKFETNQKNYINAMYKLQLGRYKFNYYFGDNLLTDKEYKFYLEIYSDKFLNDYGNDYAYRNYIFSDPILSKKFQERVEDIKISLDTNIYEPKISALVLPAYKFEYIQCEHEIEYKNISLEKYFEQLNNYVSKYVNMIESKPYCLICNRYIKEIDMYEGELMKKNNKLIPIVYQSIYSFAPYDKYLLSKFFVINAISSFDTIYKTNLYVLYNSIAKMFLDWLIDININKNTYEDKYKKQISSGLFFIRLNTTLFDKSVISKELYYELKYLNLYIYLCNTFIYLLDPYFINIISNKLKIDYNKQSKNYIIYDFLKKIYIIREETFELVNNIIQNQEDVMTQELLQNKKIFEKKFSSYKKILYTKEELFFLEKHDNFRVDRNYKIKEKLLVTNFNNDVVNREYENNFILEYVQYTINKDESKKIYEYIESKKYADYVYKKSQITEITYTSDYIILYYENKRILIDKEYFNFFSPIKIYPNKYYAFLYYGRSNIFNNDVSLLLVIYNELLLNLSLPYFYYNTGSYEDFFIQLIGFIVLNIETSFDKFLDKIKIIDLYHEKENEYYIN